MRFGSSALLLSFVLVASTADLARANPEPPGLYDARLVGMGGTGTSHVEGPAAIVQNPARLYTANRFSLQLSTMLLLVDFEASFAGAGQEQHSGLNVAPLAFLGGAGRLDRKGRFHLGLASYVITGFGGGFDDVRRFGVGNPCVDANNPVPSPDADQCFDTAQPQNVALAIFEAAVPFSARILDDLSLGVALRMPFGFQQVSVTQEVLGALNGQNGTFGNGHGRVEQSVVGYGSPGVMIGVDYSPIPELSVGAVYRSKVHVDMQGDTDILVDSLSIASNPLGDLLLSAPLVSDFVAANTMDIPTQTTWYVPHMFKLGATLRLMDDHLRISLEGRATLNRDANKEQVFTLGGAAAQLGLEEIRVPFDWKNVYHGLLGLEYLASDRVALRAGTSLGNSATPEHTAYPFAPPPGFQYATYAGFGYTYRSLRADVAMGFGGGRRFEREAPADGSYYDTCRPGQLVKTGCPGEQSVQSGLFALSLAYVH